MPASYTYLAYRIQEILVRNCTTATVDELELSAAVTASDLSAGGTLLLLLPVSIDVPIQDREVSINFKL